MRKKASLSTKNESFKVQSYVKPHIPEWEVKEIKEAFDSFDLDGNGVIDPSQLKYAFNKLGFHAKNQSIYQIICDLEADGSRGVEFEQFLNMMTAKVSQNDSKSQIKDLFSMFDDEKTGYISIKSLRKINKELGEAITEEELEEMILKADQDNDGLVSEQDFYRIMTKKLF